MEELRALIIVLIGMMLVAIGVSMVADAQERLNHDANGVPCTISLGCR